MRSKTLTISADGSGNAAPFIALPTCRLWGVWLDIDTLGNGATLVLADSLRTFLTMTTPSADTMFPVSEILRKADGTANSAGVVGEGGVICHGGVTVTVSGATASSAGSLTFLYE